MMSRAPQLSTASAQKYEM
ncbi:hypothetical protein GBAR_LOCUS9529 [Geodia barretti]|uniref:Uncharacterized protein n=1 Tax=Geodia barretti TaxID=519541 RepID=A0AA35RRR8_GEOBA|nr:hypothetical protein GBAR_LOCUS9529 [Geodia barretti]